MQKIILIIIIVLSFVTKADCQVNNDTAAQRQEKIFTKVDVEAQFTGGDAAWKTFLQNNLQLTVPRDNGAPRGSYTVIVKFVVSRSGTVGTITAETNHGYGMEAEAIRVMRRSPRWTAATAGGRAVSSWRRQPITFLIP